MQNTWHSRPGEKVSSMSKNMQALVIDDEAGVRCFVADVLREDGWIVCEAETAELAYERLHERHWSLVFCDVVLSGEDGYAVLHRFAEEQPRSQVVLMTGRGSAGGALEATAGGAYDYLLKPFSVKNVQIISRAIRKRLEKHAPPGIEEKEVAAHAYTSDIVLIGQSAAFVEMMKLVGRVAQTTLPVLITGESGTGKEVVARAIHRHSQRAAKAFVAVNCGALPSELIESELFGHVRGSFTGAERDRQGLFEEADGGTIFLDEITETTAAFQVKLLRALQEGEIRRVGSSRAAHVDVRVIAATNRDPEVEVQRERFRQDLLYRLNAVSLHLPPLRERREDILALAQHFATRIHAASHSDLSFSPEAIRLLENYPWPGNIRELENAVIRAVALCDHTIRTEDLPERVRKGYETTASESAPETNSIPTRNNEEWPPLSEIEGRYIARVLAHTGDNKQAAARLLVVDRKTLQRMIIRHKLTGANEYLSARSDVWNKRMH
jgi:DNA-binding NtrC family response regulator